ncbi:ArpU family phage packaging/lysis transcriptional regulator [Heyndrickxia oleronia]|jgi:ArpU family phage transcriptional regulator|uniref:ArpU family phage packaging/lysis transcriptional regulator n=1 Tax=Heyndrickxia oleronia TaxID=38875 RepID=UPI00243252B1|nr:ArpU family phage packaging/lysis transcriptional regulator [Heyndrickxia oleronia]MCI1592474.1 ArpU family transcriptional regulator [Heyndrickxia oleronia]MCI1615435.1 ArpU family transcriptional regulator [Heyndrickxia oleronia]MCI1746289.1 ArpU family transcriptional regulator [Heyndrickxia oleronia]MCI1763598.1 ArpU family transcriptional regulator [Heyndrickxia oleronia]
MGKQLSFMLPEIDREATQANVEKEIAKYRLYCFSVPEERLPKVTSTFSLVPPSNTNAFHSSTEDIAIERIDEQRKKEAYIEYFRKAVNRLPRKERQAFVLKYLGDEELFDYEVYNELGMSESYYHKKFKPRIFYNMAFALRVEVYLKKD